MIISHRGNLYGPDAGTENSPNVINSALKFGFDVEVDVRVVDGKIYLGHDEPQYEITADFLQNEHIWSHCKNKEALTLLSSLSGVHYFWHQSDTYTITSRGFIWMHSGEYPIIGSICVLPNESQDFSKCRGVCTDWPFRTYFSPSGVPPPDPRPPEALTTSASIESGVPPPDPRPPEALTTSASIGKSPRKFLVFGSGYVATYLIPYIQVDQTPKIITTAGIRICPQNYDQIQAIVREHDSVICCVGRISGVNKGKQINSVDYLEDHLQDNIRDNLYSQMALAQICSREGKHFTCINTGCIYSSDQDQIFKESDHPNFFGSSYSIVKGYLDQMLNRIDGVLNIRIRMPINGPGFGMDDPHSLVNKLLKYSTVTDFQNSMTYIPDIFPLIARLILAKSVGCFNAVNSGSISNREIKELYTARIDASHRFEVSRNPVLNRSNALLSNLKLREALNVEVRDIRDCIKELFTIPNRKEME